jgi:tetratricopeptide (TPR) repeat protein
MAIRLHLRHIPELDHLTALEYGRVDEGTPDEWWRPVGRRMAYLYEGGADTAVGFKVVEESAFDVNAPEHVEIWGAPSFDAPMLGLTGASAGDEFFTRAAELEEEDEALEAWLCCLEAGEAVAHYGVGVTLYRLDRYREAYRHLRYYTEISPRLTWSWYWYGRAAETLGLDGEAQSAYRRAVDLENDGGPETRASELLAVLERRVGRRSRRPRGRRRRR